MSNQDGVQVQVAVGKPSTPKTAATLGEVQADTAVAASADACSNSSECPAWSTKCMWGLFLVGWLFPPAWWVGTLKGLRCGHDDEFFIKHRKGTPTISWAANLLMSLVSAVVLIIVLAAVFGRPGPQQEGPYFIAITGTADVLPDFTNRANLDRLATAVHGGLALPETYPVSRISVFLDSSTATPENTQARRRLLQVAPEPPALELAVLGYTLERTPDLPDIEKLADLIDDGTATEEVSSRLVSVGLVKPEHVGKLQLGLLPAVPREKLASVLNNKEKPAFSLPGGPVGQHCMGRWTEWTPCVGCGNKTRTFIMPPVVEDTVPPTNSSTSGAEGPSEATNSTTGAEGPSEATNTTRRLQATSSNGKPNGNGKPNSNGVSAHGQQGQSQGLAQALASGLGHALGLGHAPPIGGSQCAVLNNTVETRPCIETCPGSCGVPQMPAGDVTFMWSCGMGVYNDSACAGTCMLGVPEGKNPVFRRADALCNNGTYESPSHECKA